MMRKFLLAAAAVLLCSALAVAAVRAFSARATAMQQFARTARERTVAPRFSVTARYTRCTPDPKQGADSVPREACGPDQDAPASREAFVAGAESADPDSLHASALAELIWWDQDELSLNDALTRLEKAHRLSLDSVPLLVDLSGAHLLRAERTQNPRDLLEGLNYASEALAVEPRNLSALWNRAMARHAFGLEDEAARAWDAYLAVDSRSSWADEARQRKARLARPAALPEPRPGASAAEVQAYVEGHAQEARVLGWGRVLGDWGRAVEAGDAARAAVLLDFADTLGLALARREGGDRSLAEAVRAIRAARADTAATALLARAHRAFANGYAHFERIDNVAATAALDTAALAQPPSPVLMQWTTLFLALCRAYIPDTPGAIKDLRALLADTDTLRYPALAGRARLSLATLLTSPGDYPKAVPEYEAAAWHLRRAGEIELEAAALSIRSEAEYLQGDTVQAYRSMHRALRVLRAYPQLRSLQKHMPATARSALNDGMPWAALSIADENVPVAMGLGIPIYEVDALFWRARVRTLVGDTAGAVRDFNHARQRAESLPDEKQQSWARDIWVANPVSRSIAEIDAAVAGFEDRVVWLGPALIRRADALLAAGDLRGATMDLDRAARQVRTLSGKQEDVRFRSAMLEQGRSSFDRLVMLHVRANRPAEALRALERGRVSFTSLGDGGSPADRTRLAAPPDHVALEYALIGDTLLIWTVRGEAVHLRQDTIDRTEFLLTVEQTSAALESPARAARATPGLRRLYDWLIHPVRDRLGRPETPLVILADGEVAGVPFAALLNSTGGRYLIQDYPLRFAATLEDAARPAPAGEAVGPALLVSDPDFNRGSYPTLDELDGARDEVAEIRDLYRNPVLLEGNQATREAFIASAQKASVIHYAGHAVFDDARPERSFLVLAGNTAGRLTAEGVDTMDLRGVRLVVLSACRTLPSRGGRSGGFAGLSGALLKVGAGGVVGSLWQVNDQRTRRLMVAFHRAYQSSNGNAAAALREAQLEMLRSDNRNLSSPATWAGFRYAGH